VCDGKCYRLYTGSFFEREMAEVTVPEIQRTNMLTAVLYLKGLPFDIDVLAFDYLDSPGVCLHALVCCSTSDTNICQYCL
jgi:ATP-dependent RNA helicase DHX8/PRP22